MLHSLENGFYFWSNFGVKSSRLKYFVLMPENKIILTYIFCDSKSAVFILVKLNPSQEESWEENLNGKVWTSKRTANNGKRVSPMMLQFSEPRNKPWIFWNWFVQISDLRKSSGSHFSWISLSLTLYPYIEMVGLVTF